MPAYAARPFSPIMILVIATTQQAESSEACLIRLGNINTGAFNSDSIQRSAHLCKQAALPLERVIYRLVEVETP